MTEKQNKLEQHFERYQSILRDLTLMSDVLMRNVLKEKECAEYVLRTILNRNDLTVTDVTVQQDHKNLHGRSAILDCVAADTEGSRYDIEVQQGNGGASPKRARYHSGMLDANTLKPGEDFDSLPDSYVIFITEEDVLGDGLQKYQVGRKVKETGKEFNDHSHIIYVNTAIQDDTELGRLIHDFHCRNANEMYSETLAEQIRNIKETEKGVTDMCQEMEKIYKEGIEQGIEKGIERMVLNALQNRSAREVSEMLKLPLEQVLNIERQMPAQ